MKGFLISLLLFGGITAVAQNKATPLIVAADASTAKADEELEKKASEWTAALSLPDKSKSLKVSQAIAAHLRFVRDWNNSHPHTLVPEGINPATGNRLSELDRQLIACSSMPAGPHQQLMNVLRSELDPLQVEAILDKYTIGKVDFTLKGYKAIVPDLTAEEERKITEYLKQAREQAIDYKSMKLISAIFEIYKTKCEQYLNSNGRDWRKLYKTYVDKAKAEKEAAKNKNE